MVLRFRNIPSDGGDGVVKRPVGSHTLPDKDKFLFYTADDGAVKVEVLYKEETVWLTQKALAELFGVRVPAVNKHLKNVFETGELVEDSVISILETTAADGKSYKTRYYNLDAIIAVGYRVNSYQATQFRIWATRTLKEFIIKGFVLDDVQGGPHSHGILSGSHGQAPSLMNVRFPFGLVYGLNGDTVVIVAVAHLHREPRYWSDRIK